ncbi:MAG: hypothetical protein HQL29_06725, partial [Candidatus Omnitrophica bacterium]|nr:hypothetical protein [Candidatus Omnitrophota bacterium]
LSNALIKIVNELENITNRDKMIEIPVKLKGSLTNVEIIPDLNYLAKKFLTVELQKNVQSLLKDSFASKQTSTENTANNATNSDQTQPQNGSGSNTSVSSIAEMLSNAIQKQMNK